MKGLAILVFLSLTSIQAFGEDFITYDTGIEMVKDSIREGELRKAEDLLRRILHHYPGNPEALSMLARVLFWQRDFNGSIEVYQQILQHEDDPSIKAEFEKVRVAKVLDEAELMLGRGETAEARRLLEELFDSGRERYESGYKLGMLYVRTRQYEKAKDIFERLKDMYPDDVGFTALFIESLILNGDIGKANLELSRSGENEMDYIAKERADLFYRVKKNYVCIRGSFYDYTKGIKSETDLSLEISQRVKEMTFVLWTESISRFGLHDDQVTLQVYSKIGEKTRQWGYLALSFSPNADFLPKTTISGEFYQGYKWVEFSAGYMRMNFRKASVGILIPGLIIYLPYGLSLSERLYYVPRNGSVSLLSTLSYEPNHKFRGFYSISIGKSAERIMSIVDLVKLTTIASRLSGEYRLAPSWSLGVELSHEYRERLYNASGVTLFTKYWW
jgi:YaiO family outer membrane protein